MWRTRSVGHVLAVILVVICACLPGSAQAQDTEPRVALVIGNTGYSHVDRLANPGNDAKLIADTLRKLGFTMIGGGAQLDLDKPGFDRVVQEFGQRIQGADVALFYYAGHGMQVQGTNWLLPVDANPTRLQDFDFQMVDADLVLKQMDGAGTRLNIVILDACRNNPFANLGTRGVTGGLAQMRAPEGTLISFATQPGNVAVDGSGADGPYATALAEAMRQPGLDIFRLFNQVGLKVKRETQGNQQPWVSSSPIDGDFYFARTETTPDNVAASRIDDAVQPSPPAQTGASRDAAATKDTPPTDPQLALQALAEAGRPDAQIEIGLAHAKGLGVPKDDATALQWFQRAAAQGYTRGQFLTGVMYERGLAVPRSYASALEWYRRAAEQNFPPAEIAVARFYERGIGIPRDPAQRNTWLLRAADQGSPLAQHVLGNVYRHGDGVPQDMAAAAQWYQRATAQGFVLSETQLGLMYAHGAGVKQDYAQAMQLLRLAADKGNPVAQNGIGVLYLHGDGVKQDYAQAQHWFRQAADQGNGYAEFNIGLLYADGLGMPRDKAQAREWFQKAAAAGNEQAILRLARMEPGKGLTPHSP